MDIIALDGMNFPKIKNLHLCLGDFDGVHLGHAHLIKEAIQEGGEGASVLLFEHYPSYYFDNGKSKFVLNSLNDRIKHINSLRIKRAFLIQTSLEFYALEPIDFIQKYLKPLNPACLYFGTDFHFGKMAKGDGELLEEHFPCHIVDLLKEDGNKIASRDIKVLIQEGKFGSADALLGYSYQVTGKIVKGLQNGRKIGFPTINLSLDDNYVLPPTGVYEGYASLIGEKHKAIINLGTAPTVGQLKSPIIEAHLADFKQMVYGEEASVSFARFIRPESKFSSLEELKKQLEKDKRYFD